MDRSTGNLSCPKHLPPFLCCAMCFVSLCAHDLATTHYIAEHTVDRFFPVKKVVETVPVQDVIAVILLFWCANCCFPQKRVLAWGRGYCAKLRNADHHKIAAFCFTNCMLYSTSCSQNCLLHWARKDSGIVLLTVRALHITQNLVVGIKQRPKGGGWNHPQPPFCPFLTPGVVLCHSGVVLSSLLGGGWVYPLEGVV